ncbi:hypothetical protein H0H92_004449 [Tricholoma furcatifolium]|nr:hypothetical protein H0H92_004449 [Tricholoma furcatifolium]
MANIQNDQQVTLSEKLLLLYELDSVNDIPGYGTKKAIREARLLDTIAVALTTGDPGDVFAAAFDKRDNFQLVLAKNGLPNSDDINAATELMSLIASPDVTDMTGLWPFLVRRCGRNIEKRIHDLHTTLQDPMLREDLEESDLIQASHERSTSSFDDIWRNLIAQLTDMTAEATDNRLDLKNVVNISLLATTISHAPFLKSILDDPNRAYLDRKARVLEKFKRRLDKVRQYVHGITKLVTRAKRLAPISHRWVMDDFSGTGEGTFTLCDDPHEAVSRGLRQPLSPGIVNLLDDRFPSLRNDWGKQKRIHACVHAELRIILHFGQVPSSTGTSIPIGLQYIVSDEMDDQWVSWEAIR